MIDRYVTQQSNKLNVNYNIIICVTEHNSLKTLVILTRLYYKTISCRFSKKIPSYYKLSGTKKSYQKSHPLISVNISRLAVDGCFTTLIKMCFPSSAA